MELKIGDKVDLLVVRNSGVGFTVLVDGEYEGMLYKNELFNKIHEGEKLVGFVKKVRDDGKIDVSLQQQGFKNTILKNELIVLKALKENDGFIALHDKSDPSDIKHQLGMSKKAFKSAIGGLYRQKIITISEEGITKVFKD